MSENGSAGPVRLVDADFHDIDALMMAVRDWNLDFRLLGRPPSERVGRIVQSTLGALTVGHARLSASLEQFGAAPQGRTTFVIMETGMRRLYWRGHETDCGSLLIYNDGSEISCFSGSDFDIHALSLDEESIAEACQALEIDLPPQCDRSEVVAAPAHRLVGPRRGMRALRSGAAGVSSATLYGVVLDLVDLWVSGRPKPPPSRLRDRALRRSLDILHDLASTPPGPHQLAQMVGASDRTLLYAFRERFGMTPAAFMKARRLAAVRRDLQVQLPDRSTVSDILAQHDFWHLGQFAKDYRKHFGELPSDTLARKPG